MNESKISVRYARAIFELAKEKNILDRVYRDMELINTVMLENPSLSKIFENPVIPVSRKKKVVSEIFRESVHQISLQFLGIIVDNKREAHILMALRRFIYLYRKEKNITEVKLTTAHSISPEISRRLTLLIEGKFGGKVDMSHKENPDLIGGFILRVDDLQLDASVTSQLKNIRRSLMGEKGK